MALLYRLCIEAGFAHPLADRAQHLPPPGQAIRTAQARRGVRPTNCGWPLPRPTPTKCGRRTRSTARLSKINGVPVQARLIAFIDDASRVCCHGQFFPAENVDTLIESLRAAFYKRGVPHSLYVDNGSIYTSKEILQICARVGCLLHHTPVRDGAAKGKIERFFSTVRDQFLARDLDLSSLEALNRQFTHWVEEHYNAQVHSVLGMSPLDRFALDRKWVRFLPPNEANDELFFVEEERHVRADNTFSFKSLRWEAPASSARPHHPHPLPAFTARRPRGGLLQGRTHGRSPPARSCRQRQKTVCRQSAAVRAKQQGSSNPGPIVNRKSKSKFYDPLPLWPPTQSLRHRRRSPCWPTSRKSSTSSASTPSRAACAWCSANPAPAKAF